MNLYDHFVLIIKPDAVLRGLIGKILARFEEASFYICDIRYGTFGCRKWMEHYAQHKEKPFFQTLIEHMRDRSIVAIHLGGQNGIVRARKMIGNTDPLIAEPGTIRGDYGNKTGLIAENLVHVSDSKEAADRELAVWFE